MADEQAETGSLPVFEADPICYGLSKYHSMAPCNFSLKMIKASLLAQVAEDKLNVPLPCDEAPNRF